MTELYLNEITPSEDDFRDFRVIVKVDMSFSVENIYLKNYRPAKDLQGVVFVVYDKKVIS